MEFGLPFWAPNETRQIISAVLIAHAGGNQMKILLSLLLVCLLLLPLGAQTNYKTPHISSVTPNTVRAGSGAFALVVNGSNFGRNSVVRWNGADRPTVFAGAKQIKGTIGAADVAQPGVVTVVVFNYLGGTVVA